MSSTFIFVLDNNPTETEIHIQLNVIEIMTKYSRI